MVGAVEPVTGNAGRPSSGHGAPRELIGLAGETQSGKAVYAA